MATPTRKPILIAGAGIASLLLGRALRRASIPFRIFERDNSIVFRAQGYRLRLSNEGLDAIEAVLGPDGFQEFWDACGKTGGVGFSAIDAITGEPVIDGMSNYESAVKKAAEEAGSSNKAPGETLASRGGKVVGISRGDMRKVFLSGSEEFIDWGRQVTGYESTASGVRAIFADGSKSIEGEMLVGGEGLYSRVAEQLSGGKLKVYDTGARGIHGQAPTTAFKALGEGVWRAVDSTRSDGRVFIITNVRPDDMDDPNVQFGWTMGAQPGVIKPPNEDYTITGIPAATIAKSITKDWHPRLKPLFEQMAEGEAAFWKITCSTPSGVPEWPNDPRVTVIGDAVHSMTPAGGIGANTAVRDSALLGKLLAESGGFSKGVTAAYEKEMRVYASEAVGISYGLAKSQFGVIIDENTPTIQRGPRPV
ncbi:putative FAD-binding domain protein [Rosellinia necatrix]|uniref:Putative FAD-binding domain protein n=1 Tax=Rosellinia necatrix TaxID=77044 RepID=A0A1W2TQH4_ROSNE|nr:putative FAD-binding domain protein [Rosellinia necatrix]